MGQYRTAEQVRAEFGANPRRALIITTVVHESRAVNAHLAGIERIAGANGTIYTMGRFPDPVGDWHIVHVITQAGNSDASVVATKAHGEFGKFDVQMFVGVAGSLKEDIPIGSVVVGDYVYNSHSGKLDDNGYYSRPHSHTAAPELLKAAQILVLDGDWINFIKDPLPTKLPATDVYPCRFPPEAVIKGIASGEQVVAGGNTPFYQIVRQHMNDAGAIEMEGFGAMSAAHQEGTSAIVVRGISDMCDGKSHASDAMHQPVASAHAAAFAFAILSIRSKASPLSPGGGGLSTPSFEPQLDHLESDQRIDYVVNLKGTRSDWSDEAIERLVDGLKKITGDPELTLVRVDTGSVRVVVSVREKDVPALTLDTVGNAAGDVRGKLLGAVSAKEAAAAETAKEALRLASANLLSWEQTLPGGGWLERPEKGVIESRFDSESSSTVVLGEPGSGKSALLAAIASDLIKTRASVLAIKADFVPTNVHSEHDLQAYLQLPALPGELIERLAQLEPIFLLVDQLDALASQLDLRSDRLNVLLNLVRRVGGTPNVHIVLSARTFEFNHDVRLRAIEAEAVTLMLPAWHEVKQTLSSSGIDADTWPENARDVVRNPQALKTYLSLTKANVDQPFSKYQSMLEQLWRQKIATAPDSDALVSLASDLAGTMAEEEMLWLAASRFDGRAPTLERLESVGLIVRSEDGKSIAFSHQTVFDYVLARSFVRAAGRLSSYVLERQNSLFVRAKLWSALRYLRDAEIASYEREFLEIWRYKDLRRHLRLLLVEFLGEVDCPIAFEKVCFEEVMQSVELRIAGLKSIVGHQAWFANFARSAIPAAMASSDIEANQALRIIQRAWPFSAEDVIRLLRERWLPTQEKDGFTWMALDACPAWTEDVEQIADVVLSRTPITSWQVDYTASVVAVAQPAVALKLIRKRLDFLLAEAMTAPEKPYPTDGSDEAKIAWRITDEPTKPFTTLLEGMEWISVPAIAEAEPKRFLEVLWPWYKSVFNVLESRDRPATSELVYPGLYSVKLGLGGDKARPGTVERPILSSLRLAVEGAAKDDHTFFTNWADENSAFEFMAPQRLIAHGFTCAPQMFAQKALHWLFGDLRRLQLGSSYGPRRTTTTLISAISPFWTSKEIETFESRVKKYRPAPPANVTEPKQRRHFNQMVRRTRASLLAAISPDRLSGKSNELVATEKRALGEDLDRGIGHVEGGFIGSPMSAEEMTKAKDRDILKIFREVSDNTGWDHPTHWLRGGNIQLSRAFAEFAKTEPLRALRIMEQFEPSAQERAAGYALDSMAESGTYDLELQDALLDLHRRGFGTEEFRNSAASGIEKMARRPTSIGEPVINVLTHWLTISTKTSELIEKEDHSGVVEEVEEEESSNSRQESILWGYGGISILPSGNFPILSALTSILLGEKEEGRDRLLIILNDHLSREQNPKVWQALLIRLSNAGGSTPEIVSKFLRALFVRFPALIETREAIHFLAYAQRWDDTLVYDLIAAWDHTNKLTLRQAQGELVGLISTVQGFERWTKMREDLLANGSPEAKLGLAYAGANLWTETQFHADAGSLLLRLIPGADETRMSAILDIFRLCDSLDPDPITLAFLKALTATEVDLRGAPESFVVERLQSLLPHGADIVGSIALKLVASWRSDLSNISTATSMAAPQLTDLAITLHRLGGTSRETGVTIFEELIELDAYGAHETLTEIDGRFGIRQSGARRRITRRAAKHSNRASSS